MKRYLWKHLGLGLVYVGLIVILNLVKGNLSLIFWRQMVWFGVGVILGVWLLFLDRLVYVYIYPKEQLSQHVWYLWKQKKYRQALDLLDARRSEQQKLIFRSALLMVVWVVLALFSLTSSLSWMGKGVVMGLMWHVLVDAWRLQRIDEKKLRRRLFWQIKREFSHEEQVVFLVVMSLIFGVFSLWV